MEVPADLAAAIAAVPAAQAMLGVLTKTNRFAMIYRPPTPLYGLPPGNAGLPKMWRCWGPEKRCIRQKKHPDGMT